MKKRSFLAGMLTMALIVGLGMSALAATGAFTITVDPVNIQVNGTTFAPKDAKGNDVPVFAYGGTTYAPLRALAEAYGLTVGYDGTANMATVSSAALPSQPPVTTTPPTNYSDWSKEDEAAYQEFKGLWTVEYKRTEKNVGTMCDIYLGYLAPPNTIESAKKYYSFNQITLTERFIARMMSELMKENDVILMLSSENKTIPEDARDTGNDIGDYRLCSSNPNGPAWYYHFLKP